jgi:hypothetical protein
LDDEDFNLNQSPISPDSAGGEIGASRQQQAEIRTGPAGNRKAHMARDAFSFFEANGDKKQCKFCL